MKKGTFPVPSLFNITSIIKFPQAFVNFYFFCSWVNRYSRQYLFFVLMGKQMLLAILVVALALGAEPELQLRAVQLRPPADGALVLRHPGRPPGLLAIGLPPVDLLRIHPV